MTLILKDLFSAYDQSVNVIGSLTKEMKILEILFA